ncbi:hypothetical protein BZG36_01343 [Bifiguratus adelaidae]|uniref:NAD-dependent epimerase/dehydratase domain-containing protein n=1 Tax=Bifiguratus adelaidae TaxID=1938954 RepID=A0A261Y3F0_9FUNG|nr:hypothetical protein BZG36_01343 [Bifiguratus adelaidae]
MVFGVDHLGPFLLALLLMDKLKANPSRVINVSSYLAYAYAPPEGITFDNLDGRKGYNTWTAYGVAKLANILHAQELQRRFGAAGADVTCVALSPGTINTNIARELNFKILVDQFKTAYHWTNVIYEIFHLKTVDEGASTTIYCAVAPNIIKGEYYAFNDIETKIRHQQVGNVELAQKLWEVSEAMVGEKP